jgi:hypothetical protein
MSGTSEGKKNLSSLPMTAVSTVIRLNETLQATNKLRHK